jgi:hypothetical protein
VHPVLLELIGEDLIEHHPGRLYVQIHISQVQSMLEHWKQFHLVKRESLSQVLILLDVILLKLTNSGTNCWIKAMIEHVKRVLSISMDGEHLLIIQ